jgi:DNA-binding response OmpR family regulator
MHLPQPALPARLRTVVTDHDPVLLTSLIAMLKSAHHAVFAAYDGLSACELAEYIPDLDLVISNTRLLNMDAPALIRRVRNSKPWLAILHVGDPLPQDGPLAGVPSVREPFTSEELLAAVASVLAKRPGSEGGAREREARTGALRTAYGSQPKARPKYT